jgi:hypothetical protein
MTIKQEVNSATNYLFIKTFVMKTFTQLIIFLGLKAAAESGTFTTSGSQKA